MKHTLTLHTLAFITTQPFPTLVSTRLFVTR